MTNTQTRQYTMLTRVRDFGEAHPDVSGHSSAAREQFAAVAAAVRELSAHAVEQLSATQQGSAPRAEARRALTDQVLAIGRTARAMPPGALGPGAAFRVPAMHSEQALLTAGRLFARDTEAAADHFVTHGMPPTFVGELRAAVAALERAIQESDREKRGRTAARSLIRAATASGMAAVRRLDAIMANQLRGHPATLEVWKRARRVGQPRHPRGISPPVTPAPDETRGGLESSS